MLVRDNRRTRIQRIALGVKACEWDSHTVLRGGFVGDKADRKQACRLTGTDHEGTRARTLVVIDDWGYLPMDREEAQLLFQVVAASYE